MAFDYDRLWVTKGLKGIVNTVVEVSTHEEALHSGNFSGRFPDPMFVHRFFMDQFTDYKGNWKLNTIEKNGNRYRN